MESGLRGKWLNASETRESRGGPVGGMMLEHIERLIALEDVEAVWALHCERMAAYGFDRLVYGFSRFVTAPGFGNPEDNLVLSNHEKAYLDEFIGNGLFGDAPMVRWSSDHVGACSWGWAAARAAAGLLTPAEIRVLEFNRRHGVLAGYSIAFPDSSSRAKGGIGLCARSGLDQEAVDAIWAEQGREIMLLNALMHLKITTMPFPTSRRKLTKRQREVLEWVADGKTTADIALLLGLTPGTIEKHLRLAREALDVETTAQAVLKASLQRQIFLNRPRG